MLFLNIYLEATLIIMIFFSDSCSIYVNVKVIHLPYA